MTPNFIFISFCFTSLFTAFSTCRAAYWWLSMNCNLFARFSGRTQPTAGLNFSYSARHLSSHSLATFTNAGCGEQSFVFSRVFRRVVSGGAATVMTLYAMITACFAFNLQSTSLFVNQLAHSYIFVQHFSFKSSFTSRSGNFFYWLS